MFKIEYWSNAENEWLKSETHFRTYSNSKADEIVNNSGPHIKYRAVMIEEDQPLKPKLVDSKAALVPGLKPDPTHVRTPLVNYIGRASEYGNAKGYERGNYQRKTESLAEDFRRLRAYLAADMRHKMKCLDAMEAHEAIDPMLEDIEGMKRACYAPDTDDSPIGPSMLPHLCGAAASLNMALVQAVNAGLLPEDPGQPWVKK
jgi:hypothetical protein